MDVASTLLYDCATIMTARPTATSSAVARPVHVCRRQRDAGVTTKFSWITSDGSGARSTMSE